MRLRCSGNILRDLDPAYMNSNSGKPPNALVSGMTLATGVKKPAASAVPLTSATQDQDLTEHY